MSAASWLQKQGKQFLREASGRLSDFYVRVRDLGEGAYGEVFLARQRILAGSHERNWSEGFVVGLSCFDCFVSLARKWEENDEEDQMNQC